MIRALITLLLAGFALAVLLLSERPAEGKSKRKAKRPHGHSHGHGHAHEGEEEEGGKSGRTTKRDHHGHAHSSPWIFGAGVSVSKSFGSESNEGSGEGGGSEAAHGHAHLVGEGHAHDAGGEGSSEEDSVNGVEPTVTLNAGYRLSEKIGLNLGLGFVPSSGLTDPSAGGTYSMKLSRSMSGNASLSATVPLSEASRKSYKITTVSLAAGPTVTRGRWTFGGRASVGMSSYSKTVVVEEEAGTATTLRLQDDHGDEHEIELEDEGTGDREFNRFGLTSTAAYRLTNAVRLATGLGGYYVTHQFGESKIETTMTVIEGGYTWKMLVASLGIITTGSDTSLTFPKTPGVTAAVLFIYE